MPIGLTAGCTGLCLLAVVTTASAQDSCIHPATKAVDAAETQAWREHEARRDLGLMGEIAGRWTGDTRNPDGTVNQMTVAYGADGTLAFTFRECGRGPGGDCTEIPGRGTWAAFRQGGSIAMARRLSTEHFADLCQHVTGVLTDPDTFVGADGQVGRRLR